MPERIVLVTIDTLRPDRLGCYGDPRAHTPRLDTLASSGVRFANAVSPAPLTLPSHTSLMTALEPPGHGVRHNSIHRLGPGISTLAESMRAAGYHTAAFVGALVLDRRFGLDRGFEVYDDHMERFSSKTVGYAERPANRVVDAVLDWLAGAPPRFFLWVHFYDPHALYVPPPGFAAAFADDRYGGEVAFVDHQLGRLLDALRARFGPEGLLLAITSDHGESFGEHGEQTHSYGIYDATQRIPLIFVGTGVPPGRVAQEQVRLLDVGPTLLAAAGAAPLPGAVGRDLGPLLRGGALPEEPAYLETLATWYDYAWSPLVGLRVDGWKYVRAPTPELYELAEDPAETHNLASERPEVVARLDAALETRLARGRASQGIELPEADRERLRGLGYVVSEGATPDTRPDRASGPDPKDEISLLARVSEAERHMGRGEHAEALALLRDLDDPPPHVSVLRAAMAQNAGEPALAVRDARRVLAREPDRLDAHLILAHALEALGDDAGAAAAFAQATTLDPRAQDAWEGLVRTARASGDAERARVAQERLDALAADAAAAQKAAPASAPGAG